MHKSVNFVLLSWEYMLLGIIKPQKKFRHVSSKILEVPAIFVFTKEFPKKYKGKNAIKPFLLSFLAGRSNQRLVFTRLLHLYCCFHKHPYRPPLKPYGNMALWPQGHIMAIWPYHHMAIWPQMATIWVSPEKAIKMQQFGEDQKLIGPPCKK